LFKTGVHVDNSTVVVYNDWRRHFTFKKLMKVVAVNTANRKKMANNTNPTKTIQGHS